MNCRLGRANSLGRSGRSRATLDLTSQNGEMDFALQGGDESPHSKSFERFLERGVDLPRRRPDVLLQRLHPGGEIRLTCETAFRVRTEVHARLINEQHLAVDLPSFDQRPRHPDLPARRREQ